MAKKTRKKRGAPAPNAHERDVAKRRREPLKKGKNGLSFEKRRVGVSVSMKNETWSGISALAGAENMSISAFIEEVLCGPFIRGELVPAGATQDEVEKKRKRDELKRKKAELDKQLAALEA